MKDILTENNVPLWFVIPISEFGGGKINRKITMVLLLTLALTLCLSSAVSAATTQKSSTTNTTAYKAAGSATTTISVSNSQMVTSAKSVKKFVETNKRLPNYVTISNNQITMPEYMSLLSTGVVNLNSKKTISITVKSINAPTSPSQNLKTGTLTKSEYVKVAGSINSFITKNGRLPNYASTSLGTMNYGALVYDYAKIVAFYGDNKRLPNTVAVSSSSITLPTTSGGSSGSTTTLANAAAYLVSTTNAPANNPTIKNLAASITKGKTTTLAKAQAIFNWVRDNLSYSYYYNTVKGALGALSSRSANCVDTSHLVVALARAAGIPARYQHGYCHFSDGWFGHVWAQLYVDGKWYYADAINDNNALGKITNWNLSTFTLYGTYITLPF